MQFAPVRKSQIEQTIDMQEAHQADAYLFLGDLNMRDIEKESNERLDANYVDLWQAVHGPIEPGHSDGFTFDLARNPTARQISERVTAIKRTTGNCRTTHDTHDAHDTQHSLPSPVRFVKCRVQQPLRPGLLPIFRAGDCCASAAGGYCQHGLGGNGHEDDRD